MSCIIERGSRIATGFIVVLGLYSVDDGTESHLQYHASGVVNKGRSPIYNIMHPEW